MEGMHWNFNETCSDLVKFKLAYSSRHTEGLENRVTPGIPALLWAFCSGERYSTSFSIKKPADLAQVGLALGSAWILEYLWADVVSVSADLNIVS